MHNYIEKFQHCNSALQDTVKTLTEEMKLVKKTKP